MTDNNGRFVFVELVPGPGYTMTVGAVGYLTTSHDWEPGASNSPRDVTKFRLNDGEWKRDLKARVWRRATITGVVTDELNEPVIGVPVRAYAIEMIAGLARLVPTSFIAVTDDRGVYRLEELEPGAYKVGITSPQATVPAGTPEVPGRAVGSLWRPEAGNALGITSPLVSTRRASSLAVTNLVPPTPSADGRPRAYSAVFHPGVRSLTDAGSIMVDWGEDRTGIDLRLQTVPAFAVSGRLDRAPASPILLRLLQVGYEHLGFGSEAATTLTEKDGAFTFLDVPVGQYTVLGQASVLEFSKHPSFDSEVPPAPGFVSVGNGVGTWPGVPAVGFRHWIGNPSSSFVRHPVTLGGDVTDLVLPLETTGSVRGQVVYADGSLPPSGNAILSISLEPVDGDPSLGNPNGRVDASRSFTVDGVLPGRYFLTTSRVISSITVRGRDVINTGFEIRAGETVDDVIVTLTGKPAQLKASVADLTSGAKAAVIVFPTDRTLWTRFGWNPKAIVGMTTDANSLALFSRLPAGEYFVVAVPPSRINAWTDPKFLEAAAAVASRLSLAWGETKAITVKVERVQVR